MDYLTAEQIAEATDDLQGQANRKAIFKAYRRQDESRLWPVSNRFNATDRAIRRVGKLERANGALYGLELCYAIESELSDIVNNCY